MKLKINGFENEIIFNDSTINIIEVNDAKCFTHIIDVLNQKINGYENNEIFLLDQNDEELKIDKNMYLIFDLFNIDYNSKKILNKLYEVVEKNIKNSQDYELDELTSRLKQYLISEVNELPFEFIMNDSINVVDILKVFNLKIDSINYTRILEKLELLVDMISTLKIANILVIPNLKMYLNEKELLEFYKYSLYNNINLLIIERFNTKLKYEKILKIDEFFNDEIL